MDDEEPLSWLVDFFLNLHIWLNFELSEMFHPSCLSYPHSQTVSASAEALPRAHKQTRPAACPVAQFAPSSEMLSHFLLHALSAPAS